MISKKNLFDEEFEDLTSEEDTPMGKIEAEQNSTDNQQNSHSSESKDSDTRKDNHKEQTQQEHKDKKDTESDSKFSKLLSLIMPFDTSIPVKKTELIGGLFARGYVTVLGAPSGTGKSLAIQKMFTDLSNGGDFLQNYAIDEDTGEYKCFAKNEPPRKCLVLCGELGEQGLRERAQEFDLHHNPQNVIVLDQITCEEQGFSLMINDDKGRENLEFIIEKTKPDILFIDSFSAFFTGKENDNSECNEVFGYLRRIAKKYQIALVITHHSRKRLSSEQGKPLTLDDLVGAQAITRHVYSVIFLEYNAKTKLNVFTNPKSWGRKFKPFGYSVRCGLYGQADIQIDLAPATIDDDKLHASTNNANQNHEWEIKLIGYLLGKGKEGATTNEIIQAIGEEGIERSTYLTRLSRLIKNGEIIKLKRGIYALPEDKLIQSESEQSDTNTEMKK